MGEQQQHQKFVGSAKSSIAADSVKAGLLGILQRHAHNFRPSRLGSAMCPGRRVMNCDPEDAALAGNVGLIERLRQDSRHCTTVEADKAASEGLVEVVQNLREHGVLTSEAILTELYDSTHGDAWLHRGNWRDPRACHLHWHGISSDFKGNVVSLVRAGNRLAGQLPDSMGQLRHLQHLNLSRNELTGPIPENLTNLTRLQRLNLSHNMLTGRIPEEVSRMRSLQELSLSHNRLEGQIPEGVGRLWHLVILILCNNQLTGRVPASMTQLQNMRILDLSGNRLSVSQFLLKMRLKHCEYVRARQHFLLWPSCTAS